MSNALKDFSICSYKGVEFIWYETKLTGGHKVKLNEYAGAEEQAENVKPDFIGKKRTTVRVVMEPINQEIKTKNDLIRTLGNSKEPGELILPNFPPENYIAIDFELDNSIELPNRYRFTVTFVRASTLEFPFIQNDFTTLENQEEMARKSIFDNALEVINNNNLVSISNNILGNTTGRIYSFINNNAIISAIKNVNEMLETIRLINLNRKSTPRGAAGVLPSFNNLNNLKNNTQGLTAQIKEPVHVIDLLSNVYEELATAEYVSNKETLNVFYNLANKEFPQEERRSALIENLNAKNMQILNTKLALLQLCLVASKTEFVLQQEVDKTMQDILFLRNKLNSIFSNDIEAIFSVVDTTNKILKNKRINLYRIETVTVEDENILSLTYKVFNNIDKENMQLLINLNPSMNFSNINGNVNILRRGNL